MTITTQDILDTLAPRLQRTDDGPRPVIVMMCGISGSGKSSLSHLITTTHPSFTRLSTDALMFERHGLYGIDYPKHLHAQKSADNDEIYERRFRELLADKRDVVLDRSFYAKEDRVTYKGMIEQAGARWVLVYLRVRDKEALWRRIEGRRKMRGKLGGVREGDAAYDVTREVLEGYWNGWEAPEGEGEVVFDVL